MDSERSDGGEAGDGEPEVEDEFACAGMLRGSLTSLHSTVERIFRVTFGIGAEDLPHGNNGQIWLKLRGPRASVTGAKLFVKGVVNQEEQQEVSYPGVLHCIFCGARGLFVDSLIRNTSAHIVVGSPGCLLISGLAEPVVRAYSLIADLVARYEGTQSRRIDFGEKAMGESLDSRRAFKTLVEKWEDRHILDLLVLPGSVKEILLDLVKESGPGLSPSPALVDGNTGAKSRGDSNDMWEKQNATKQTLPDPSGSTDRWAERTATRPLEDSAEDSFFQSFFSHAGTRGRAEGAEDRLQPAPWEMGEEQPKQQAMSIEGKEGQREDNEQELHLSMGNKEFLLLLKFFTAMGYTEDVVKRVLARTGLKEASQILDLVQQEQDHSDRGQAIGGKKRESVALNQANRPCETEHKEDKSTDTVGGKMIGSNGEIVEVQQGEEEGAIGRIKHCQGEGSVEMGVIENEEDFVLGVLKKAAVSCGYTEQNVAKVYNMMPDGSTRRLLLELQREGIRVTDSFREEPREIDDVVLEKEGPKVGPAEAEAREEIELFKLEEDRKSDTKGQVRVLNHSGSVVEPDLCIWTNKPQPLPSTQYTSQPKQHQPLQSQTPHKVHLPEVKGPPMPIYSSSLNPPLPTFQSNKQHGQTRHWPDSATSKQNHQPHNNSSTSKRQNSNSIKQALQVQPPIFPVSDWPSTGTRERRSFMSSSSVVVTGEQRFLEGLQTSFELKLTDKPGDPKLRTIIIDGSNVAMSHGLGHFFSCRGIALAIQHFWDRGHRHISALLPQWRQKSDPRIKEQHYLTELHKLGLVSYTPSREVHGKRISSYDDRFILQLAQTTDGVIVTNDNLRDLSDESPVWRDIIKKRLLQYTFVGDLFMIPDDPLGRGGPHLDDFLRSGHKSPIPGNHSFAGLATASSSSKPPRSQTEVLNFRDRIPGVTLEAAGGGGRGKGRVHGKGWDVGHQHKQHGVTGPELTLNMDRTPEETAGLREQLSQVFPDQDNMVTLVLQCHTAEKDINVLSDLILEQQKD